MRKVYQREKSSSLGTRAAGMRCGVRLLDYTRQSAHVHVAAAAMLGAIASESLFHFPHHCIKQKQSEKIMPSHSSMFSRRFQWDAQSILVYDQT